eukprot:TRINITY_DN20083_c0_g1_i1.p1 TRINITY_DN20083_c0_g1~~TRINITY_DN20083_c0_g1_i1.p1  ORF type:complete len:146 (+),score=42.03 TRINITY_DN20083_c0_g1_i1:52-438(+)
MNNPPPPEETLTRMCHYDTIYGHKIDWIVNEVGKIRVEVSSLQQLLYRVLDGIETLQNKGQDKVSSNASCERNLPHLCRTPINLDSHSVVTTTTTTVTTSNTTATTTSTRSTVSTSGTVSTSSTRTLR